MTRKGRIFLFVWGVAVLAACSTLPEYAAPKARVSADLSRHDMSDVILYRTLTRADFRGERPPPELARYVDRIGAATCAHILTTPDTQVNIQAMPSDDGGIVYRASPRHLRFYAQMDRNCSWWNPRQVGLPADYILEHEQIHFALFELEARRLNEAVPELEEQMHASAESVEAASHKVQQQLIQEIRARLEQILARSRAFDEDTSMGHNPEQQRRWWKRVRAELAASGE